MNALLEKYGPLGEIFRWDNQGESTTFGYLSGLNDSDNKERIIRECDNYCGPVSKLYIPDQRQDIIVETEDYLLIREYDTCYMYDSFVMVSQMDNYDIEEVVKKLGEAETFRFRSFLLPGLSSKEILVNIIDAAERYDVDYNHFAPLRTALGTIIF